MPWIYCYQCSCPYPLDNELVPIYKVGKTGHKDPNKRNHNGLNKPMKNAYIDICIKVKNHTDVENKLKPIMKNDDKFTFIDKLGDEYFTTNDEKYLYDYVHSKVPEFDWTYIVDYNGKEADVLNSNHFKFSLNDNIRIIDGPVRIMITEFINILFGEQYLNLDTATRIQRLLTDFGDKFKVNSNDFTSNSNGPYMLPTLGLYVGVNIPRPRGIKLCRKIAEEYNINFVYPIIPNNIVI